MTREEAINTVRNIYQTDKEKEALATLIPELAESEDERIRKKMIEHFKSKTKDTWCNMPVKSILAWLEKQKEQKPAEWNDTDMKEARANLISVCMDWERGKQTTLLPIAAVRARYFLEHLTEPKPAEWSEEDEKTINDAYGWLCEYAGSLIQRNYGKSSMLYGIANKLKSLHSQYQEAYKMGKEAGEASHWKPTEHQMTILKAVKEYVGKGSGYWGEGLGSLIDDLEKL